MQVTKCDAQPGLSTVDVSRCRSASRLSVRSASFFMVPGILAFLCFSAMAADPHARSGFDKTRLSEEGIVFPPGAVEQEPMEDEEGRVKAGGPSFSPFAGDVPPGTGGGMQQVHPEEDRIRDLLEHTIASAYRADIEALKINIDMLRDFDRSLEKEAGSISGLTDNVADILHCTIKERKEFRDAQKKALKNIDDKELESLISHRLKNDPLSQAQRLEVEDKYNRIAFIFNTLSRDSTLLLAGYIPALINTGGDLLLNTNRLRELSLRERKTLFLYEHFLRNYPDSEHAGKIQEKIRKLKDKVGREAFKIELRLAESALSNKDFDEAIRHYTTALEYKPASKKARQGLHRAEKAKHKHWAAIRWSLIPDKEAKIFDTQSEYDHYEDIVYSLLARDVSGIIDKSEAFIDIYPESTMVDDVKYAESVAYDMDGQHELAKKTLKKITARFPGTNSGEKARYLLEREDYNRYGAFNQARKDHAEDTLEYIALGTDSLKTHVSANKAALLKPAAATRSMGTYYVMGVALRAITSLLWSPVPADEIIDKGEQYLHRYPDSEHAGDIHRELAQRYEQEKEYEKAIYHYGSAGVSSDKIDKLRKKAARHWQTIAERVKTPREKRYCYQKVVELSPDADSQEVRQAEARLEELQVDIKTDFIVDKAFLRAHPVIWNTKGLNLKQELFDDRLENGEIAGEGIRVFKDGSMEIVYETEQGIVNETYEIDRNVFEIVRACYEDLQYQAFLKRPQDYNGGQGSPESSSLLSTYFPFEIRGSVSKRGVSVYPRLKPKPYREKDSYLFE